VETRLLSGDSPSLNQGIYVTLLLLKHVNKTLITVTSKWFLSCREFG